MILSSGGTSQRFLAIGVLLVVVGFGVIQEMGNGNVSCTKTTIPSNVGDVHCLVCQHANPQANVLILHSVFHTGLVSEPIAREIARHGFRTITPLFSLLRLPTFSQYLEQMTSVAAWIRRSFPIQGQGLRVIGHSLGANMAVLIANQIGATHVAALGYDVDPPEKHSWHLFIGVGVYDQLHPVWQMRNIFSALTGNLYPQEGKIYENKTGDGSNLLVFSPTADHTSEIFDPYLLSKIIEWLRYPASGDHVRIREPFRATASILELVGLICVFVGIALLFHRQANTKQSNFMRWGIPLIVGILFEIWWRYCSRFEEINFFADLTTSILIGFLVSRVPVKERSELVVGIRLLAAIWLAWLLTTILNGLPGLLVYPKAVILLPAFAPWKLLVDLYEVRGFTEIFLTPIAVSLTLILEAVWPGIIGSSFANLLIGLKHALQGFDVQLKVTGSLFHWGLLFVVGSAAIGIWSRLFHAGYDFGLVSMISLAGLFIRIILLPCLICILIVRSAWGRKWLQVKGQT